LVMGICIPGRCGVGDYTRRLAQALGSLDVEAELMSEGRWGLLDVGAAIKTLDARNPDIIHIQYPSSGFGHRLGAHLLALRRSTVTTCHEASQAHVLQKVSLYAFAVRSKHLIFTSECERQFAKKWAPWVAQNSSVIPLGSNIEVVPDELSLKFEEVTYFGLIMPGKGLEDVFRLAEHIQKTGSSLKVRIIGQAHERHDAYLREMRARSEALPIVWSRDLNDQQVAMELARASVAYLPFPDGASERRASLKAVLASGLAVVTKRGPQTPRELDGIVRFADSPEDAYRQIRMLVENPVERKDLKRKAVEYMKTFSWTNIARLHVRIYQDLIEGRTCSPAVTARQRTV
jgi:glycosyltransferase involved in cell wall biosynthesis